MLDSHYSVPCTLSSLKGPKSVTWRVKRHDPCALQTAAVKWTSPSMRVLSLKDDFQFSLYTSSDPKIHTITPESSELALQGTALIFALYFSPFISLMLQDSLLSFEFYIEEAIKWFVARSASLILSVFLHSSGLLPKTQYIFSCKLCTTSPRGQIKSVHVDY